MQNTVVFFVFSVSLCSFVTVFAGTECNKEDLVMVWHWVYRGSSYSVWNCKSRNVVKLVVLSCWGVVWVVFVVFLLSRCSFVTLSAGM